MFYEIRRYKARPGCRDEWVRYMEGVVIPFQVAGGMSVTASFIDEENPDGYVWIRRFEDEAQREACTRRSTRVTAGATRSARPSWNC